MGLKSFGTQKGDSPRTPTLRQYIKSGKAIPGRNYVNLMFKPNDFGQIGLITSSGFRVTVSEESPLYGALIECYENLIEASITLVVVVTDIEKCVWELSEDEDNLTEWEEHNWGFKSVKMTAKKKLRASKKPD